jgi:hypothetical protein
MRTGDLVRVLANDIMPKPRYNTGDVGLVTDDIHGAWFSVYFPKTSKTVSFTCRDLRVIDETAAR